MSQQENSILINEHALNREPVPLSIICTYMFSLRGNDPFREAAVQNMESRILKRNTESPTVSMIEK